jgi:uncharacterized protein (TIGR00369 family)
MTEDSLLVTQQRGEGSPFGRLLGFIPVSAEPGHVIMRLPFKLDWQQSLGRIHGGTLFALADHASGWAAHTTLKPEERCATLEMKINFIGAVYDEDCLAEARVIHKGRTSVIVEAEIKTAAGRLVGKTLATFIVLREVDKSAN